MSGLYQNRINKFISKGLVSGWVSVKIRDPDENVMFSSEIIDAVSDMWIVSDFINDRLGSVFSERQGKRH